MRVTAALLGLAVATGAAQAGRTLSIDGVWGNAAGCKYLRDGDYGEDDMLLLRPDSVESFVTGCDFVEVMTTRSGKQVARGICGYEGEGALGAEDVIVFRDPADAELIHVYQSTGDPWGEVRPCR